MDYLRTMSEIYVFNINNLYCKENFDVLKSSVSQTRREKSERFYFLEDAKRCICAEAIMRHYLITNCGAHNQNIKIGYNEYGKPHLIEFSDLHFSISHSNKWVVCGWSKNVIGIDIEEIKNIDINIVKSQFCKSEYEYILTGDRNERIRRFIQLWTLKESYIKFEGKGLNIPLNSFCIRAEDNVFSLETQISEKTLYLKQIEFSKDYFLAECCCDDSCIEIRELSLNELLSVFL